MSGARKKQTASVVAEDGRSLRAAKNHEAIVQALYDLVRATHLPPTVADVAKHAGVGMRTVFRQFEDLDALYRSLAERVQGEIMAKIVLVPPSGDLDADLRVLVGRRARIFEHLAPFRRAARLVRHTSNFLQEQDATTAKMFRTMLEAIVSPHLAQGAEDALEALDVLLSFETWDRLRDRQQLTVKRAERVLAEAAATIARAAAKPVG